jgi:hypothetical protein
MPNIFSFWKETGEAPITPTPTPTITSTATPTPTPTPTSTFTPTPTPSSTPGFAEWIAGGVKTPNVESLIYSLDGFTWYSAETNNYLTSFITTFYDGTKYYAGGSGDETLITSPNGFVWENNTNLKDIITGTCSCVGYDPITSTYIAGGSGGERLAISNDGLNWSATTNGTSVMTGSTSAVEYNGSMWVVVGGRNIGYSSDGLTWSGANRVNLTDFIVDVVWNGNMWVATSYPTYKCIYSYNGIDWSGSTSSNTVFSGQPNMFEVIWDGGKFIASGGFNSQIGYSYDGIDWSAATNTGDITTAVRGLGTNGDSSLYIAVGNGTRSLANSYDGITWTGNTGVPSSLLLNGQSVSNKTFFSPPTPTPTPTITGTPTPTPTLTSTPTPTPSVAPVTYRILAENGDAIQAQNNDYINYQH